MRRRLTRRSFIRSGLGGMTTFIGLPLLEVMIPPLRNVYAQGALKKRLLLLTIPNGFMNSTNIAQGSVPTILPRPLGPIAPVRNYARIETDMNNHIVPFGSRGTGHFSNHVTLPPPAPPNTYQTVPVYWKEGGTTPHRQAYTAVITGCKDIEVYNQAVHQKSLDHHIAQANNERALVMSCDANNGGGGVYLGIFSRTTSWANATTPIFPDTQPQTVFTNLFPTGAVSGSALSSRRFHWQRQSILDGARADVQRLQSVLGSSDRQTLESYLTALRETEMRLQARVIGSSSGGGPSGCSAGTFQPASNPNRLQRLRDFLRIAELGFRCDVSTANIMAGQAVAGMLGMNPNHPNAHDHNLSHELTLGNNQAIYHETRELILQEMVTSFQRMLATPYGPGNLAQYAIVSAFSNMQMVGYHVNGVGGPVTLHAGAGFVGNRVVRSPRRVSGYWKGISNQFFGVDLSFWPDGEINFG